MIFYHFTKRRLLTALKRFYLIFIKTDHHNMNEKHLVTANERDYFYSGEGKEEESSEMLNINSSDPSLNKNNISKTKVNENCSSFQEKCSEKIEEKSCSPSYATSTICKSDEASECKTSAYWSKHLNCVASSSFRGNSDCFSDDAASESSTVSNVDDLSEEDKESPPRYTKNNFCMKFSENNIDFSASSHGKNAIDSYASDMRKRSKERRIDKCKLKKDAIHRYFDSFELPIANITSYYQTTTALSGQDYEVKSASMENVAKPSTSFANDNIYPQYRSCKSGSLSERSDVGTVNAFTNLKDLETSINDVLQEITRSQSGKYPLRVKRSSNVSNTSDSSGKISSRSNPAHSKLRSKRQCCNISQIEEDRKKTPLLNDDDAGVSSEQPIDSKSVKRKDCLLKRSGRKRLRLEIPSIHKEHISEANLLEIQLDHSNNTKLGQNKMLKRSLSHSPGEGRYSKTLKLTSLPERPAEH